VESVLLKCEYCPKTFFNQSSLRQHTAFHSAERPFICKQEVTRGEYTSLCGKSYKSRSELNRHLVSHSASRDFECNVCAKRFLRRQYLKTHLGKKHPDEGDAFLFPCTGHGPCTKMYLSQRELDCHILTYHFRRARGNNREKQTLC
jgi:uncharacterized Zn-finger protein